MRRILCLLLFILAFADANAQFSRKKQKKLKPGVIDEASIPRDKDVLDPDTLRFAFHSQRVGLPLDTSSNLDLYYKIYEWIGTPYRFGGSTKRGIDCSAFTNEIYQTVYKKTLERDSRSIYKQTIVIPKTELREGDLVFFRIRRGGVSHVGVYLGDNKFVHASTQRGVIVSDLNEGYYRRYYYKSGRIVK